MNIIVVRKLNESTNDRPELEAMVSFLRATNVNNRVVTYASDVSTKLLDNSLFVALGGDGTMMFALRLAAKHSGTVIGFNFGNLGFLVDYTDPGQFLRDVQRITKGDTTHLVQDDRQLLCSPELGVVAVNEFSISAQLSGVLVAVDILVDGQLVGRQRADSILISTPTGSTAYSLSAGGAIMSPTVSSAQITAVAPHTLTSRPLIVPMSSSVEIVVQPTPTNIVLKADGVEVQNTVATNEVRYHIQGHNRNAKLWHQQGWNYYDVLANKMLWLQHGG